MRRIGRGEGAGRGKTRKWKNNRLLAPERRKRHLLGLVIKQATADALKLVQEFLQLIST